MNELSRNPTFAVVDVETTGFSPRLHDRIIEIAVLRIAWDGRSISEYTSLLNPERDIGNSAIHGIYAGHVSNAPRFSEIVGDLVHNLKNSVFVAHNAAFDLRFVRSEFERAGHQLPHLPHICTMQLARKVSLGCSRYDLETLCHTSGILRESAHTALDDARVTAKLLFLLLEKCGTTDAIWESISRQESDTLWPEVQPRGISLTRISAAEDMRRRQNSLQELFRKAPPCDSANADTEEYVSVLDKALEDRILVVEEVDELIQVAASLGLSKQQISNIHEQYYASLLKTALRDDTISGVEQDDLDTVGQLLRLTSDRRESIQKAVCSDAASGGSQCSDTVSSVNGLNRKRVCFTGQFCAVINGAIVTRETLEKIAVENGITVKSGVSKKLDFLVTADPESLSGKARKARELGVRILSEAVFWSMLGIQPE